MEELKGFSKWIDKEQHAGERLPYARLLNDSTILLRNGSLMQCLHVAGYPFETADEQSLEQRKSVREMILRAGADSHLVIYHHLIRRRIRAVVGGRFEDPVCDYVNNRWQNALDSRDMFVNELYITILHRPREGKIGLIDRITRQRQNREERRLADLKRLEAATASLLSGLESFHPRLLESYDTPTGLFSEPLELLAALYNGDMRPVLIPEQLTDKKDLGDYLPVKRISFGLDTIERCGASSADRSFSALFGFKEYPPYTSPGLLDSLLRLPHEIILSESFSHVDRQIALERISLALRRLKASDDDGYSLRSSLAEAKDAASAGKTGFGEHHLSVLVNAPSLPALDQAAADVASVLADTGSIAVREDLNLEAGFWGQFPGNRDYVTRKSLVSVSNFADLASLHCVPTGQPEGHHWGDAVTIFETSASTPRFFSLHKGDLGHFSVIGPTGSGKTVVLNFLLAQAQKFKPRTVFFDKDRGAEIFLRAIGGNYASLSPGRPTGFNPLQIADTPAGRAFLQAFITCLVADPAGKLTTEEEARLGAALDANFEQPPAYRRLRYFQELLGGSQAPTDDDMIARLAPWHSEGEYAWVFDNATDSLDFTRQVTAFDMTELLDEATLCTPAMMYMFYRLNETLDGTPTMIMIDEGWKLLDNPFFSARLRDWMKTFRKRNAIVGFGTQSARDALESSLSRTITEQVATQIFMPNARALESDYCAGFGLGRHEYDLIRALPPESHAFLVKQGNESSIVRLNLAGLPDLLRLFSGNEASLRQLDRLRVDVGDAPENWWPELIGTPWPGDNLWTEVAE
ncbi:VirB4 family type IV secretion/conjugal transfer ATPase [Emcibacter nanhaiensis]|uniref:VirB4 family type IV secretion/conjugal transfer ATPase n=1 Tax=Emcibacter nanhaiensis TaxID=1505037 RepID=UPI00360E7D61